MPFLPTRRAWPLAALLLSVGVAPALRTQAAAEAAAAAVHAFYRYHLAHDMAFTRAAVRRRERWLTPDLLALCRAYFAAPSAADEPPPIEGDPFTDSQEYPASFQIGVATVAGDTALVPVTFSWKGGGTQPGVTVVLAHRGGWRIADIRFARGGTLRDLLAGKERQ